MSARAITERRKKRERRLAREQAEREWVCGGPLVDVAQPVIGGDDARHPERLREELARRSVRMQVEAYQLLGYFAHRCCLVKAERQRMLADHLALLDRLPPPTSAPTHSTHTGINRPTIPAL